MTTGYTGTQTLAARPLDWPAPAGEQETAGTASSWVGDPAPAVSPNTSVPDGGCGSPAVASAAPSTSARPLSQGEGEAGRAPTSLQQFARSFGFRNGGRTWSYDDLLSRCADAYWQNRPQFGPRCGTEPGYRDHTRRRQPACRPCRAAYASYRAANRERAALGLPPRVRELRPCGTHAAFVRHKARGEEPCSSCETAERAYQRVMRRVQRSPRELRPCGTHAAFVRHKSRGEQPCPACETGERQYQHDHQQRQRTSAAA